MMTTGELIQALREKRQQVLERCERSTDVEHRIDLGELMDELDAAINGLAWLSTCS
jgi:hypothetical protein